MPTLTQLRYVLEVVRLGHFGRAAKACHVSQPTLSTQIAKAEEGLGVQLLDRQTKPIRPTPTGAVLIEQAQAVVAAHNKLKEMALGEASHLAGPFSLGIIPTISPYLLPWFLPSFAQQYPSVELSVSELTTEQIVEQLKLQQLDAAILATPLGEDALVTRPLFYDAFFLYAHCDESVLRRKWVSVEKLDVEKLWLLSDGHCFRNQVVNYCNITQRRALFGSVTFVAGTIETLRNLIDSAGGYTLVPDMFVETLPTGVRRDQVRAFHKPVPTREVSMVHHRNSWKRRIANAVWAKIDEQIPDSRRQTPKNSVILPID